MPGRNLILSGGVGHPFDDTSALLRDLLGAEGIGSEISTDVNGALASLAGDASFDLLTVNALRWRMRAPRYSEARGEWAFELSAAARLGVEAHVARGGGVLGVHTASICFDDWAGWGAILGGRWDWDRSCHPPVGPVRIRVVAPDDPLVAGIADFDTVDEVYGFLHLEPDVEPLLSSAHSGAEHPLAWRRTVGRARVAYLALGHDLRAYRDAAPGRILRRAAAWCTGGRSELDAP